MSRALAALVLALAAAGGSASAQARPDFTGLWLSTAADISVLLLPGQEIALTPYGAERYRKLDMANSPSYTCLPVRSNERAAVDQSVSDHPDARL